MTEVFTAKTVEEAKSLAAAKFGKNINQIKFEVLDEGKKGFLGIGKSSAKVKATYEPAQTAPKAPVKTAPKSEPPKKAAAEKKVETVETKVETVEKPVEKTEEKPAEKPQETVAKEDIPPVTAIEENIQQPVEEIVENKAKEISEPAGEIGDTAAKVTEKPEKSPEKAASRVSAKSAEKPEKLSARDDDEEFSLDNFTLIEDESLIEPKVKIAVDYITSVLRAMDIEPEFTVYQNETGAVVNIESNNNGTVIGRRGETLDSLQYLCSIIANKGDKDYFRITIDCLGYRSKRKDTLEQLAVKVAKSVLKTGRSQPLEPMNPYERRVIHSAISEIEGVSSRSVGEEPYRKIIISSNNPKQGGRRRNPRNDRNNRRNDKRPGRHSNEPIECKPIDLSTSFEKDYKKPKPEDSMEGGLYGKIEL
ncbi:MAG: Jag N-terminal domain-containing protein [Ruminococcus sp.]|nr:Jag N-terminal domain-containing protein [Ruminococcus sp.]